MKYLSMTLAITLAVAPYTSATSINNTKIEKTEIIKNGNNASEKKPEDKMYDRGQISDEALRRQVVQETAKLNVIMREATHAVVSSTKNGEPDMQVIAQDATNTRPLTDVIRVDGDWEAEKRKRELEERMQIERLRKGEIDAEEMKAQTLRSIFPVRTTLKPTRLPSRMVELPPQAASQIMQPMAVIGTDSYSLSWFKQNVDLLEEYDAGIIVTEVASLTDLQALQTYAPTLNFNPVDASTFLNTMGVSVYPILITRDGAFQ